MSYSVKYAFSEEMTKVRGNNDRAKKCKAGERLVIITYLRPVLSLQIDLEFLQQFPLLLRVFHVGM